MIICTLHYDLVKFPIGEWSQNNNLYDTLVVCETGSRADESETTLHGLSVGLRTYICTSRRTSLPVICIHITVKRASTTQRTYVNRNVPIFVNILSMYVVFFMHMSRFLALVS
jgi:hypothetical protein